MLQGVRVDRVSAPRNAPDDLGVVDLDEEVDRQLVAIDPETEVRCGETGDRPLTRINNLHLKIDDADVDRFAARGQRRRRSLSGQRRAAHREPCGQGQTERAATPGRPGCP
jgi:hypothetical protein